MSRAPPESLKALGLEKHQALIVAHRSNLATSDSDFQRW